MRDSQDSELFGADDRLQAENSYSKATQHYDNLLRSVEQGVYRVRLAGLFRCIDITRRFHCSMKLHSDKAILAPATTMF